MRCTKKGNIEKRERERDLYFGEIAAFVQRFDTSGFQGSSTLATEEWENNFRQKESYFGFVVTLSFSFRHVKMMDRLDAILAVFTDRRGPWPISDGELISKGLI